MALVTTRKFSAGMIDAKRSNVWRNETLPGAEYIEKLFGAGVSADWPKTAADASRHDDAISFRIHKPFRICGDPFRDYNNTAFYPNNQEGSCETPCIGLFFGNTSLPSHIGNVCGLVPEGVGAFVENKAVTCY